MAMFARLVKLISPVWTFLRSRWRVILLAAAAIVVALVLHNFVVGAVGIVGTLLLGSGNPTDSPRRTASGNIPNNPSPPGGSDSDTNAPGTPGGGPRRRRR